MRVDAGVILSAKSFRNPDGMLSGPATLFGSKFKSSFLTPVLVKVCISG